MTQKTIIYFYYDRGHILLILEIFMGQSVCLITNKVSFIMAVILHISNSSSQHQVKVVTLRVFYPYLTDGKLNL